MLTTKEIEKLRKVIIATTATPIVGSIEDYSWEAIFHYVKGISLSDPALGRSKLLHDAVDIQTQVGWSLKSLQLRNLNTGASFSFVIQRADVVKKANGLGFPGLTEKSPESELGNAIIEHWNQKILLDQSRQGVTESKEGILLKNPQGNEYIYTEYSIEPLDPNQFSWSWTVDRKTGKRGAGLQGSVGGQTVLIWYKNQKQLFRVRTIPPEPIKIAIERKRLTLHEYVEAITAVIQKK